jgi:DNA-binding XRE family transcriptional regulator
VLAVVFEQATIKIEKEKEFEELKTAITRAFSSGSVQKFLKRIAGAGIRVRDFDSVLAKRLLEQQGSIEKGKSAQSLYGSLTVTDQAQMKEFYLSKLEEVGPELRAKFQKIYQYY